MKARYAVVVALAAAVTLTAVAAAGPGAAKQRVAITGTILPSGKSVLTALQAGAMKRDSGTVNEGKTLSQRNRITTGFWTFTGTRGDLVFRERREWVDLGSDLNRDGFPDVVALGTWEAVRGWASTPGLQEAGGVPIWGLGRKWVARFEGFLTVP